MRYPLYQTIVKGLNLGIHELGHIVFAPFGEFMMFLGGSLLQCLVPVISVPMFYKQRDYYAIGISFGWLSTNLFDVATYVADARSRELMLVTPFGGGEAIHDWYWLLNRTNLLQYDHTLALLIRMAAVFSMLICLVWCGWLVVQMFIAGRFSDRY